MNHDMRTVRSGRENTAARVVLAADPSANRLDAQALRMPAVAAVSGIAPGGC